MARRPGLRLVEIKIAERLFDGRVFGFLQAFGEFAREDVFFRFFGFHRETEFFFDAIALLAEEAGCVVEVDGRRSFHDFVGEHDFEFGIDGQLGVAARAVYVDGLWFVLRHAGIVRQSDPGSICGEWWETECFAADATLGDRKNPTREGDVWSTRSEIKRGARFRAPLKCS